MVKNILLVVKKSSRPAISGGWRHLLPFMGRPSWVQADMRRQRDARRAHRETLAGVERLLREKQVPYRLVERTVNLDMAAYDLVISVGGDGTFMEAARCVRRQLLWGINSDPERSVGSFCSATRFSFGPMLEELLRAQAKVREFQRIQMTLNGKPFDLLVMNDLLVTHSKPAATSRYWLKIGRRQEDHRSSGLWIATAAGSTGAIRSAGGKALPRASKQLQYRPRELYRRSGLDYRLNGGVVEPRARFEVGSLMREGLICADGEHVTVPFRYGDHLAVSLSPYPVRVVV